MFIIELTYKVDLAVIDTHRKTHLDWLQKYYDAGIFVASGRKVPANGGVILAHNTTREGLEMLVKTDPFALHDLADYKITEFAPRMVMPGLEFLVQEK